MAWPESKGEGGWAALQQYVAVYGSLLQLLHSERTEGQKPFTNGRVERGLACEGGLEREGGGSLGERGGGGVLERVEGGLEEREGGLDEREREGGRCNLMQAGLPLRPMLKVIKGAGLASEERVKERGEEEEGGGTACVGMQPWT